MSYRAKMLLGGAIGLALGAILQALLFRDETPVSSYILSGGMLLCLMLSVVVDAIERNHRITVTLPEVPVAAPNVHVVRPEDKVVLTLDAENVPPDMVERIADELRRQMGDDGYLVIQSPGIHADVEAKGD